MQGYHLKETEEQVVYKYEPWRVTERTFQVQNNQHNETIFSLGNGYMGVRGTLEEDYSGPIETTTPGIYLNGVYESEKIIYGESFTGYPQKSQTIVNLPDWTEINLYLAGEKFDMLTGEISDYQRILDMEEGTLTRSLIWSSPEGKKIKVKVVRFLSFKAQHMGVISFSFTPLNFTGEVMVVSSIEGDVQNYYHLRDGKPLVTKDIGFKDGKGYILQETKHTAIMIGISIDNVLNIPQGTVKKELRLVEAERLLDQFTIKVEAGKNYNLTKYVCVYSSFDLPKDEILNHILNEVEVRAKTGYHKLLNEQNEYLEKFWKDADIEIYGDDALQQGLRFNVFHLLQSTGRDERTNIAAKGLTGEFYEGHYFWDAEIYILPFFLYTKPEIAKRLLLYRYNFLESARANAKRMKLSGVLFPWRTINGEEASSFFMGSTIQYHIDADIAYAIYHYFMATKDYDFLFNYGAEILFETARMWLSRGCYIPLKNNKFCLNEVCGPDEYQPGVNNNCYTNYMAKFNLEFAVRVFKMMKRRAADSLYNLSKKIILHNNEIEHWAEAARRMYLPYDKKLGIYPQDDSFLYKDPLELDLIPDSEFPLVRNWHPLVIWRYQVVKQADVILLMFLQGDKFTLQEKKANYDFYEPKTTHDSSLSAAIYSIIASEIGYKEDAYNYFRQTVRIDLDDYNKNSYQGIHTACMAGSWLALVQGFAGMRNYDGQLSFSPYLPDKWNGYEFKIRFQGRQIKVKVRREGTDYQLLEGDRITISHKGKKLELF